MNRGVARAPLDDPGCPPSTACAVRSRHGPHGARPHARFFRRRYAALQPTDLDRTYPFLFLTRIVTHFCAPSFALLAGVGAFLYGARRNDAAGLSLFLATRGLWLILLDVLVISPVWGGPGRIGLGTLWAIGCGLLSLSALSLLPARFVFLIGAAIIALHNLLDRIHAADLGGLGPWWRLLHEPGPLPLGLPGATHYPALPWIGVVALGYGIGPLFQRKADLRNRYLTGAGIAALGAFFLLRAAGVYGDPRPFAIQRDGITTVPSFFNVSKYPPSLLYLLLTLGGAALALPVLERVGGAAGRVLETFGRTPLFFYVLHLYVGVSAALALAALQGYRLSDIGQFVRSGAPPSDFGAGLAGAYAAWALVTAALYPLCRWFAGVKRRRADLWWLSYL